MAKKDLLTKIATVVGTGLACFPVVATLLLSLIGSITGRRFLFDYLMPAELFPIALAGGLLLLWSAWRAHLRRGLVAWSLSAVILFLAGGIALADGTGLASGAVGPGGWEWTLVLGAFIVYTLALLVLDWSGILLMRDLFKSGAAVR